MREAKIEDGWGPKYESSWIMKKSLSFVSYAMESHKTDAQDKAIGLVI